MKTAEEVREKLKFAGFSCTLVNARFVKPIDEDMIRYLASKHDIIVTLEENVISGGFGEHVLEFILHNLRSDAITPEACARIVFVVKKTFD